MTKTQSIERRLGDKARAVLPHSLVEFCLFGLKQGWSALFGGLMLSAIILTHFIWQSDWAIARYDALFLFAVIVQIIMLRAGLETWAEARVIILFHITGTVMEIYKLHMGSWNYPEAGLIKLMDVPLFTGFMYAAVGSYIARVIRVFDMKFAPYPPPWWGYLLGLAIYVNFFTHHFLPDMRYVLMAATVLVFWRCRVWFSISGTHLWMPIQLAAFLTAFFLWVAENVGTITGTWLYSGQIAGDFTSFSKMGSWYLLLYVSLATVTLVMRDRLYSKSITLPKLP